MNLTQLIHRYLAAPFPIWNLELTETLVQKKWMELEGIEIQSRENYSTAASYHQKGMSVGVRSQLQHASQPKMYQEAPNAELLGVFYDKHGLELLSEQDLKESDAIVKLEESIAMLDLVPHLGACVALLVRSIQVLKQEGPQTDLSYSHPKIPFSIFVSVCEDRSMISTLRVAESILHEAMHLFLTLIEDEAPLVKDDAIGKFYSPWKHENRNARGILHGAFVFRAIWEFCERLRNDDLAPQEKKYVINRQTTISEELSLLPEFSDNSDLTRDGATLIASLLPLS